MRKQTLVRIMAGSQVKKKLLKDLSSNQLLDSNCFRAVWRKIPKGKQKKPKTHQLARR